MKNRIIDPEESIFNSEFRNYKKGLVQTPDGIYPAIEFQIDFFNQICDFHEKREREDIFHYTFASRLEGPKKIKVYCEFEIIFDPGNKEKFHLLLNDNESFFSVFLKRKQFMIISRDVNESTQFQKSIICEIPQKSIDEILQVLSIKKFMNNIFGITEESF